MPHDDSIQTVAAPQKVKAGLLSVVITVFCSFLLAVLALQQSSRHYQTQVQEWLAKSTADILANQPTSKLTKSTVEQLQQQTELQKKPYVKLYPELSTLGLSIAVSRVGYQSTTPHSIDTSDNSAVPMILQKLQYPHLQRSLNKMSDKAWLDAFWSHKKLWQDARYGYWSTSLSSQTTLSGHYKWITYVPKPQAPHLPWSQLILTWFVLSVVLVYMTTRYVGKSWIGYMQLACSIIPITWVLLQYCSQQEGMVHQLLKEYTEQTPLFTLARYIPLIALMPMLILAILNTFTKAKKSQHRVAYTYMAPTLLSVSLLVFVPFTIGLILAFMRHDHGTFTWVGIDHFIQILYQQDYNLTHPLNFYFTLAVTILWTAVNVLLHSSIGLGLALLLNINGLYLKGIYRALLIIPWAIPNYITALIWKGMFNQHYGLINYCLGYLGIEPIAWMHGFWGAMSANVVTNTWLGFPFMMVVALGALQSIPKDLYEAAHIAGASRWIQFKKITLPLLRPALLPAIILGSVWTFNMFNIIYLVSGGQPNGATDILITEAYRWAFEQDRYGYASAYSLIIFVILVIYARLTQRLSKSAEEIYQ